MDFSASFHTRVYDSGTVKHIDGHTYDRQIFKAKCPSF